MRLTLIVAADLDDNIGRNSQIPWRIPSDLARFKQLTNGHDVIMGRITSEDIIRQLGHPLPGRRSLVLVRQDLGGMEGEAVQDIYLYSSPKAVLENLSVYGTFNRDKEVFVIGGAQIYQAFLELGVINRILLTRVHTRVEGADAHMPQNWLGGFMQVGAEGSGLRDPRDQFETSYTTYERFNDHG